MGDIYQAPQADLSAEFKSVDGEYGSLEKGIRGEYQLKVGEVLSEAWSKTKGAKTKILLGLLLYCAVYAVISFVAQTLVTALGFGVVAGMGTADNSAAMGMLGAAAAGGIIIVLLVTAAGAPLFTGIQMMGLRRAADAPFSPTTVVEFFGKIVPLALASIFVIVTVYIGFFMLILPGIFLAVATSLTCLLIADKKIGVWKAYTSSIRAVSKKWFPIFAVYFVISVINFAVMLPVVFGVMSGSSMLGFLGFLVMFGYLWTIPFSLIAFGTVYRNIFGYEPKES